MGEAGRLKIYAPRRVEELIRVIVPSFYSRTVRLINGASMPPIGMGTWTMDDSEAERVVGDDLAAGYRLVDTAFSYGNERGVGAAVRASGVPREEVFITTKFNREWHGAHLVGAAFNESAQRLGVEYINRILIHWPNPEFDRYVDAWLGLVELLETKQVLAIGVSNFKATHLNRLLEETGVTPDVNQI